MTDDFEDHDPGENMPDADGPPDDHDPGDNYPENDSPDDDDGD